MTSTILKHKTVQESIAAKYDDRRDHGKKIEFGEPQIRVYSQTVGVNPSVSSGPPIQLAWNYENSPDNNNTTENTPAEEANKTYPRPVLRITLKRRFEILRSNGLRQKEILRFQKIATVTRKNRRKTIQNLKNQDKEERMEEIRKSLMCWKKSDDELINQCKSFEHSPPVEVSTDSPCVNCCRHALDDVNKAFYKMYKCDGSCQEKKKQ